MCSLGRGKNDSTGYEKDTYLKLSAAFSLSVDFLFFLAVIGSWRRIGYYIQEGLKLNFPMITIVRGATHISAMCDSKFLQWPSEAQEGAVE